MKIWVTKYWLSEGIIEIDAQLSDLGKRAIVWEGNSIRNIFRGEQFTTTRPEAVKVVEELRAKKIASLQKQIDKIKAMEFE